MSDSRSSLRNTAIIVGFSLLAGWLALAGLRPPAPLPADAPADRFSAARASEHLREIARAAHPTGTEEHARVRDYIVQQLRQLGVETEIQVAVPVRAVGGAYLEAVRVQNVIGRVPGTDSSRPALVVTAHYDTTLWSPGASDDGAGIATMLETARLVKAGEPLTNDVIFMFADAEELGLMGAKGYIEEHPSGRNVGLFLNFEARGSDGPVIMFETSKGNRWMIDQLAKTPYPFAFSFALEVYKRMPNLTDLQVYKDANQAGMNFAFIHDPFDYHSVDDDFEDLDQRSLQHQGSYTASLVRELGEADLARAFSDDNAVYFSLPGFLFPRYAYTWVIPLALLALVLAVVAMVRGLRAEAIRGGATGLALLVVVLLLITGVAVGYLTNLVLGLLGHGFSVMSVGGGWILFGSCLLAVAVVGACQRLFSRLLAAELAMAAVFLWVLLSLGLSFVIPGASYLFTWPALFGALVLLVQSCRVEEPPSVAVWVLMLVVLAASLWLWVPALFMIGAALGGTTLIVGGLVVTLIWLLVRPQQEVAALGGRGLAALAVVGLLLTFLPPFFGVDDSVRRNDIIYVEQAEPASAVWVSSRRGSDPWLAQFLGEQPTQEGLENYLDGWPGRVLTGPAPVAGLATAEVIAYEGEPQTASQGRRLELRLVPPPGAAAMRVNLAAPDNISAMCIDGKCFDSSQWRAEVVAGDWSFSYFAPAPEGFDVRLDLKAPGAVTVTTMDQYFHLPEIPGFEIPPRPARMVPAYGWFADTSLVQKRHEISAAPLPPVPTAEEEAPEAGDDAAPAAEEGALEAG